MAIYSGLSAQIGFAEEVTYGTYVAPTRFYEFLSEEVSVEIERVESEALRAGTRTLRSDRWTEGKINVEGDVELELMTKGAGLLLKHMLGGVATTQPDVVNSPLVYLHTFTPDEVPTGLTCQVGRTSVDGVTRAFSYVGCVISEWEMECGVDDPVSLTVSLLGRNEDTSQPLVTASYPADNQIFTFIHGSLEIDGTPLDVKEFSLSGENGLDDDRYFLGSQLRKKPVQAELLNFEGEVTTEFNNLDLYNKFVQGQEAALVLTLDSGVIIEDALTYKLVITMNVRFDGETPTVDGPEVLEQNVSFKCIDSGTGPGSAIKFELYTSEATP